MVKFVEKSVVSANETSCCGNAEVGGVVKFVEKSVDSVNEMGQSESSCDSVMELARFLAVMAESNL